MSRLILMRHAKSDWGSAATEDHARPLNGRGRRDAPRVADRLRELGWVPDLVISSDARRALQTWECMAPRLGLSVPLRSLPSLYHAGPEAIRAALSTLPDSHQCVLVLGHNPGWEEALAWFSGHQRSMTTANAALLVSPPGSWAEVSRKAGAWRCDRVVRPKELE